MFCVLFQFFISCLRWLARQTKIAGTAAAQKRAVILEIRTKADARSEGVGRLVLDRNQM